MPGYVSQSDNCAVNASHIVTLTHYRGCDEQFFFLPVEDPRQCIGQCAETPVCGLVPIPENHLKV